MLRTGMYQSSPMFNDYNHSAPLRLVLFEGVGITVFVALTFHLLGMGSYNKAVGTRVSQSLIRQGLKFSQQVVESKVMIQKYVVCKTFFAIHC